MEATGLLMQEKNWHAESIYIGGGTPTSLDNESFERFLSLVTAIFMNENTKEFTVECGRPDTIDSAKLLIIKKYGGNRISINPQTMSDKTLAAIGRSHNASQIQHAFKIAHTAGCDIINADLIAGLPGESVEDFLRSLQKVIDLKPVNITVHTLAVKRASKLIEQDSDVAFRQAEAASQMVKEARSILGKVGYRPYYLYRQKHMAGNMENVGYALPGTESLYNIRIMAENQTIIALGAGGISKIYYPDENRLERIPNVANYEIYIERIDDMIRRKEIGIQ
jgi:oxygen-independent coproporphyrinogen-3 oxidase